MGKEIEMADPAVSVGEDEEDEEGRGNWGGQLEFILTIVGYAVGLGNVWRFPYLCYQNGGGAFLIPYFLMLAFIGMPIFYLELCYGQFASLSPITIWRNNPMMKGLGYAMVMTNTLMVIYYNVIISWSFYYFFASMTAEPMPWELCSHDYNTFACITDEESMAMREANITANFTHNNQSFGSLEELNTPSEEYFYLGVLQISSGIDESGQVVWYLALCLLLAWLVVFLVLIRGIQSLGKVVYFSSIFPYVLLTIMLIRGVTLEGASVGIEYYLRPDWERLTDATVWSQAATQIFFSLSTCTGGLIAMASYNKFKNNCYRDSFLVPMINCFTSFYAGFFIFAVLGFMAKRKNVSIHEVAASAPSPPSRDSILVPLINCGTSFYAGFVIFSVLGFMAVRKGVTVDEVAADGPGLVFVVYPEGLSQMPLPPLWSVLFFLMLITLGFSSSFSMTECTIASMVDEWPVLKNKRNNIIFRACLISVFYLIGLCMVTEGGFYVFNIFDSYLGSFPLLFIGLFECTVMCWWYKYRNFADDITLMLGHPPNLFFRIMWKYISPGLLVVIIIMTGVQWTPTTLDIFELYEYPDWAHAIGWVIVMTPLVFIPIVFIIELMQKGGWQVVKKESKPTAEWGPLLKADRLGTPYERPGDAGRVPAIAGGTTDINGGYTNAAYVPHTEGKLPPAYSTMEEDFTAL